MAVLEAERNKGIGRVLILKSLESMKELGYAYAIVGWPTKKAVSFYEKCVNAKMIESNSMGVYIQMIDE